MPLSQMKRLFKDSQEKNKRSGQSINTERASELMCPEPMPRENWGEDLSVNTE